MNSFDLDRLPKILLHTHLEGSIPSDVIYNLSLKNKIPLSFDPFGKDIYKSIQTNNWDSFRKIYFEICACFNSESDFYDALFFYGKKLSTENIIYAEIQFSPWKHISRGVSLNDISKGFIAAIDKLKNDYDISIKMICDLVRNKDEKCDLIIDWLSELPKSHFVALGISGGTNAVERIHYRKFCEKAKNNNFKITAHAGEIEGPNSVVEIVDYLHVDRIGHGVRTFENLPLLDTLIEKNIHFELCPTANKIIGLCEKTFDPIKKIISKGINFSINTDDELIFDTDIFKEIRLLINEGIIKTDMLYKIQKQSLLSSFADDKTKDTLLKKYFND